MNNDLKILITGSLNIGKSIGEINTAIKGIQKKIDKLKLNISVDDKSFRAVTDFTNAMQYQKEAIKDLNKIIKEEKTVTKEADGVIKEKIRQHLKSGEIIDKEITKINNRTKAIEEERNATRKLIDDIEQLGNVRKKVSKQDVDGNSKGGSVNTGDKFNNITYNYDKNNQISNKITTENFRQQEQAVEKLRQKMLKLNNAGVITNSSLARMNTVLNTKQTEAELTRISQILNRVQDSSKSRENTKELEHQLKLYQQQAQINAQNLTRRYGNSLGDDGARALNAYLTSVNRLTSATPNLNRQMQALNMQFREISSNVRSSSSHVLSFGEQLRIALSRIPVWMTGMTMFYAPLRGLQDALQQIVEIDSQLTVLERVSNGQQDINQIFEESVRLASELGNKISEVNDGMINFAKSGFRGADLSQMAEVATLMANVSDMSVDEAASTVTAAMKGFGIAAKDTMHIVDSLNEVDLV